MTMTYATLTRKVYCPARQAQAEEQAQEFAGKKAAFQAMIDSHMANQTDACATG